MSFDETFETIQLLIGEFAERLETPETNRIDAYMNNSQDLVTAAAALRVKRLGNLLAIAGLDPGVGSEKLETLYESEQIRTYLKNEMMLAGSKIRELNDNVSIDDEVFVIANSLSEIAMLHGRVRVLHDLLKLIDDNYLDASASDS